MTEGIIFYLFSGVTFGLAAGFAPGPLLTLVISETLKYNSKEGIKIAFAPLISDFPIILISILILSYLNEFNLVLSIISIMGAVYLTFLGWENFKINQRELNTVYKQPQSFKKGIITNFLNPHPYIFWLTIGSPFILNTSIAYAATFILSLYLLLIGSKVLIAILTEKSKLFLQSRAYKYINKVLGLVLLAFAIHLIYTALTNLIVV